MSLQVVCVRHYCVISTSTQSHHPKKDNTQLTLHLTTPAPTPPSSSQSSSPSSSPSTQPPKKSAQSVQCTLSSHTNPHSPQSTVTQTGHTSPYDLATDSYSASLTSWGTSRQCSTIKRIGNVLSPVDLRVALKRICWVASRGLLSRLVLRRRWALLLLR